MAKGGGQGSRRPLGGLPEALYRPVGGRCRGSEGFAQYFGYVVLKDLGRSDVGM
jgi:hypothetical protein